MNEVGRFSWKMAIKNITLKSCKFSANIFVYAFSETQKNAPIIKISIKKRKIYAKN